MRSYIRSCKILKMHSNLVVSYFNYRKLYGKPVKYESRGRIQVKGKDILQLTFFVDPLGPNEEPDRRYFQKERDEMIRDHRREEDRERNIPRQDESYVTMEKSKTMSTSTSENSVGLGVANPNILPPITTRLSARPKRTSTDSGSSGIVIKEPIFSAVHSSSDRPPSSRNNRQIVPQPSPPLPNQVVDDDDTTDGSSHIGHAHTASAQTTDVTDIDDVPYIGSSRKSRRRRKCTVQ